MSRSVKSVSASASKPPLQPEQAVQNGSFGKSIVMLVGQVGDFCNKIGTCATNELGERESGSRLLTDVHRRRLFSTESTQSGHSEMS